MMNQSVVVVSGPLQPFRRGFEDRLVELGYRPSSVLRRLVVVAQFSRWLATEGIEPEELSACGMDAFVAQVASTSGYRRRTARRALRDLLGYLVELGVVRAGEAPVLDDPNEVLLRQFADHLVHERGVARHTTTVCDYQRIARLFLAETVGPDGAGLAGIAAGDVSGFVLARCRGRSPAVGEAAGDGAAGTAAVRLLGGSHAQRPVGGGTERGRLAWRVVASGDRP